MGGSSTFGYETVDGKIHYCVYGDSVLLEDILGVFQRGDVYQIQNSDGKLIRAESIDDYFSEIRYEEEDSKVRGVYRMNGTLMYKFWGDRGYFVYHTI
jgi:hypothetical protein